MYISQKRGKGSQGSQEFLVEFTNTQAGVDRKKGGDFKMKGG
jgi:hypothetical protein